MYRKFIYTFLALTALAVSSHAQQDRLMLIGLYIAPSPVEVQRAAPVYQGLALSSDRGVSWANRGWLTSAVSDIAVMTQGRERLIFLATDYGVLRSSDDGVNWKLVTGWDMPPVLGIAVSGTAVWAATARGLYVSHDNGDRWDLRVRGLPGINALYVNSVCITDREMFIATADGLFRSTDHGGTWIRSGLEGKELFRIIAHPTIPTTFAAINQRDGVWISEDGGWNWQQRNSGLRSTQVKCLAFHPQERDVLFVGTRDMGIFRSSSLGRQWDITGGGLTNFNITAIAFDPDTPEKLYAGAENGSFFSTTRGNSWQPFSVRLGYVSTILIH
jgi:hypothetical protein